MGEATNARIRTEQNERTRLALTVRGVVQGVGFRPFVYRLATELDLAGWVLNSSQGVFIEVEGEVDAVEGFRRRLQNEPPPRAIIQALTCRTLPCYGYTTFEIRHSDGNGRKTTLVLPDVATCPDCLREINDPNDRRFGYPFTNCTNCGPRYSIIAALPYDRPHTSMRHFQMCARCQAEYDNPMDRRFHAQPNACPDCGPQLALWSDSGAPLATRSLALPAAVDAIQQGSIVAVKGMGGFHLCVDARSETTVQRLRQRKRRPAKPFALMFPNLAQIEAVCELSTLERTLLLSPAAPIVLLRRRQAQHGGGIFTQPGSVAAGEGQTSMGNECAIALSVAPDNPCLGVMLPYTPLHHLLMAQLGFPIVATSGNLSDEPICIDEHEALERLHGIADFFLVHDRPILRSVDDSVVRVVAGETQILRRSRGYAPLPIQVQQVKNQDTEHKAASDPQVPIREPDRFGEDAAHGPILAVGAHLKNAVALLMGEQGFLSQHIGDLETPQSYAAFQHTVKRLCTLYEAEPTVVACDLHPDYLSTQYATRLAAERGLPLIKVQHHYAHILACMAEHALQPPVLGLSWDGTGYGDDGTIWGGEFLLVTGDGYQRAAHLRPFPLAGGDAAVKEPRRSALGLLYELFGNRLFDWDPLPFLASFSWEERRILRLMLEKKLNTLPTSSAGRLFDGVAALLDLHPRVDFEGQAAMALEFAANPETRSAYGFAIHRPGKPGAPLLLDWAPLIDALLADRRQGVATGVAAAKFHNALVNAAVTIAQQIGVEQIVLSGGCFQNTLLSERLIARLRTAGFRPYWHRQIPPNDGGIALGQVMAAKRETEDVQREPWMFQAVPLETQAFTPHALPTV